MALRIYTDESVPVAVAAGLQRRQVDAVSARDLGNLGLSDDEQLTFARANRYTTFTHDTDFIALAHQRALAGEDHWGVIYVHQSKLTLGQVIRRLKELSDLCEPADMKDHIEFL